MDVRGRCRQVIDERGRRPEPERLRALLEAHWDWQMTEYPEWATVTGYPGQNDRWTDLAPEAFERRRGDARALLDAARSIDADALDDADALTAELIEREIADTVDGGRFPSELLAMDQLQGTHLAVPQILGVMPATSVATYEDILARIAGVPALIDRTIRLLEEGVARGITVPRVVLRDVPAQIAAHVVDDAHASPLFDAFMRAPEHLEAEIDRLRDEADEIIVRTVSPAFARLRAYVEETYIPRCRDTIALTALPDGDEWYAHAVRHYTTTDLTPKEIHEIGLREVARIRGEMDEVISASGFDGAFRDFTAFLRTDPRFFFDDADDLLVAYRDIAKRADAELVKLFGRLPRLPYGVVPVPAYAENTAPSAYYIPGSPEFGRPGLFFANTYDLSARPKWEQEALTLHEAVPGHHLQMAIAQELEGMPEFRRHAIYTAYVEGWGLYAESLGSAMGFYRDEYSRFGQLTFEMWRSIRLVVDTGMHAFGWPRERAIAYFEENTGRAGHDIVVEVDRYITWPGQALAYKVGERKITQLRARAEERLGERFELRAFHDALLADGALPLDVLERRIDAWIASRT